MRPSLQYPYTHGNRTILSGKLFTDFRIAEDEVILLLNVIIPTGTRKEANLDTTIQRQYCHFGARGQRLKYTFRNTRRPLLISVEIF